LINLVQADEMVHNQFNEAVRRIEARVDDRVPVVVHCQIRRILIFRGWQLKFLPDAWKTC